MSRRRSLVVGAYGQVGRQLSEALALREGGEQPLRSSSTEREGAVRLDLAELSDAGQAAALLDGAELDAIYCAGGMTYVDGCEAQPELAYAVNARGPGVLAGYAKERGIPFVFYSTEYVFAGREEDPGPYTEESRTEPLSVYGKSKLAGEESVLSAYSEALVLRTTVVYGPDEQQKNFLYSVVRNLREGKAMKIAVDQVSTPTYNRDLVAATLALAGRGARGIFHVVGPEVLDRLSFARRIAAFFDLDLTLLEGTTTAAMNQPARRPLAAGLAADKLLRSHPDVRMRTVSEALADAAGEL
jgi:dTDP-4-dehydrorhamnose reductase